MLKYNRQPGRILIIGSGVGGLTAGIILAKMGYPVTIVEKNTLPGGLMRSYRRHGFDCPLGVHYLGALDASQPLRRLWDYLGVTAGIPLERMGIDGPIDRYIFDDLYFDLPEGLSAFEDNLHRTFPAEGKQIAAVTSQIKEVCDSFARLEMFLSPSGVPVSVESFSPMGENLARLGCSRGLKSVLAVAANLIGVPLEQCPRFYYYMILAAYLMSSWRLQGDSSQMADTFVERFRSLGGQLETGDGVENIRVESGRVKGVTLASGRWLDTDTVIAAIHPVNVTTMLPDGILKPEHTERIHRLENTKGLLVVTLAVDGRVHEALPYNLYRLYPEVDGSLSRGLFLQLRRSARPGTHLLTIMNNSDIQTWRPWVGTKSGHRGGNYELAKQERAGELIAEVSTFFGPLQGMRILDIYTPLSIRDWVGSPEGSAYGIMRSTGQLMKTAFLNRPGIDGLFFAGQNILAPGVMGTTVGSFQVVRRVIGRERFDREVLEKMR